MANEEHIKILKQGVEVWNKWMEVNYVVYPVEPHPSRANLPSADLSRANLPRAELSRANLSRAYLIEANLSRAHLIEANLSGADLRGADLSVAELRGAHLSGANLSGADLSGADLRGADLRGAHLRGAHLRGANLSVAHLRRANLSGADFNEARVAYTTFADIDLSETKGLETVEHRGPSSIGIDTIYKSRGKIPEVFLRGLGVPENFIEYMHALTGQALEFYSCFISYSHQDRSFARRLHDQLQAQGIRCWLDEKQILPGDLIPDVIDRAIKLWDKVLVCCSRNSLDLRNSWWVDAEIEKALTKERQLLKDTGEKKLALIPLDLDGFMHTSGWQSSKKSVILERYAPDFSEWEKDNSRFETEFKNLVKALRSDEFVREHPPEPKL